MTGDIKTENRKKIIRAANKIALKKGFYDTSLQEIAEKAGLTKRTVINLFETKTNLIYETVYDAQTAYFAYMDQFVKSEKLQEQSGLEQVMSILIERAKFYYEEPMRAKIIRQTEYLRPETEREKENCEKYYRTCKKIEAFFYKPLRKGKEDGSIRNSLAEEVAANLLFISYGSVLQRLSELIENPYLEGSDDFYEIMRETLQMIKGYLSADINGRAYD